MFLNRNLKIFWHLKGDYDEQDLLDFRGANILEVFFLFVYDNRSLKIVA